jgi:hypothetical protein
LYFCSPGVGSYDLYMKKGGDGPRTRGGGGEVIRTFWSESLPERSRMEGSTKVDDKEVYDDLNSE